MLWCNVSEIAPLLTHFMGEELHEILQNSSNEEYTGNKHSEGSNVQIDKEAEESEERAIQGQEVPDFYERRKFLCF
jgi:hypothetical protein